ncbi:MAG: HAMP domain-containing protein [Alphaproteobacteria bacterium]|nr:HAMP domain-containing protein [Alphaproteobacteria bacterium]
MLKSLNVGARLMLGFAAICVVLVIAIMVSLVQVAGLRERVELLVGFRMPVATTAMELVGNLYGSLATLRGYMLTGNQALKTEREGVWRGMDENRKAMDGLAPRFTSQRNKDDWAQVGAVLDAFKAAQAKVEAIAHTPDEQPASKILATEAAPLAGGILRNITAIIEEEGKLASSDERKAMLLAMADVRGSFAQGVAAIRAYLLTGQQNFRADFEQQWNFNSRRFEDLRGLRRAMTPAQAQAFDALAADREKFAPLPQRMFEIRASNQWNMAQFTLATEAAPNANKLLDILVGPRDAKGERHGGMVERQVENMEKDGDTARGDATTLMTVLWVLLGVGLGAAATVALLTQRSIVPPIQGMTGAMGQLAGGNLKTEVPALDKQDEIGQMAKAVQVFKQSMIETERMRAEQEEQKKRAEAEKREAMHKLAGDFERDVGGIVQIVGSAATELQSTASAMSGTAEETSRQALAVASASDQASTNVQTVASATEELTSSIQEISRQVGEAAGIAKQAVTEAEKTNAQIQALAEASQKIGDVVKLINDIAGQTNLLALNATIEAARAGEAGKGFAVVASEVKTLANQTGKATEEIANQITGIQGATRSAVDAIGGIGKTIARISDISTAIAAAVEEQGAATQEIARNVQQASAGTSEVSQNISGVKQAAGETGQAAGQVLEAAKELGSQADKLKSQVAGFIAGIRAS